MKIIAIVNQKGGVGKTTTTLNLASALAVMSKQVLVLDLDPQRNATTALHGGQDYSGVSISDLIYCTVAGLPYDPATLILNNAVEHIDYLPATPMLSTAPTLMATAKDSAAVLSHILQHPYFSKYDYVLMDCKPSLDLLVSNALSAADQIVIPVEPEDYAVDGLADLLDTIDQIQERHNEKLEINGILISKANMVRSKAKRMETALRDTFGELVYRTVLPNLAEIGNAQDKHHSVVQERNSRLGKLYMELAKEVIAR